MTCKTSLVLLLSFAILTAVSCTADEKAEKAKIHQGYIAEFDDLAKEKARLASELQTKIKTQIAEKRINNGKVTLPADDEVVVALREVSQQQTAVLEKMVKNNPGDPDLRFKLAMSHFERKDMKAGLEILENISPLERPGHPGGHLLLARNLVGRTANANNKKFTLTAGDDGLDAEVVDAESIKKQAQADIKSALKHLEHSLKGDPNNVGALKLAGALLTAVGNHKDAYKLFDRLFSIDPKYYAELYDVNIRLKTPEKNAAVIDAAIGRFDELLNQTEPISDRDRVAVWQELAKCYTLKKDFETLEGRLLKAFDLESARSETATETEYKARVVGERLLARTYSVWSQEFPLNSESSARNRLELLRRSHELEKGNPDVLGMLTMLGGSKIESIANEARSIYDPRNDLSAPASVLGQLGVQEMAREDFESAIRFLERSRQANPGNPETVNNLAYAYLRGDSSNAKRSLTLADEAIRLANSKPGFERYQTFFLDTRGQALMQLQRYQDAIVAFEVALKSRPENVRILEALIACYKEIGVPATSWENKLNKIQSRSSDG